MAITYMSKEGYDKLLKEIAHLESVERPRIINAISEARDKGDLSENAEYDSAKEAQGLLEAKISQLKATLLNVRIIDESLISTDSVQILSTHCNSNNCVAPVCYIFSPLQQHLQAELLHRRVQV